MMQIIGYFDVIDLRDVPRVLTPAVLTEGDKIFAAHFGDQLDLASPWGSLTDFKHKVIETAAIELSTPLPWKNESVPFVAANSATIEHLDISQVENFLRAFVADCRRRGGNALKTEHTGLALDWFDRARRVSNEADDYVRIWALEAPKYRVPWFDWLRIHAPMIDPMKRAEELHIISAKRIFSRPAPRPPHATQASVL